MKTRTLIALAAGAAAVLVCSCVPSVNPFYTKKDLVFERRVLGEWREAKTNSTGAADLWKFEKSEDDNTYRLTMTQADGSTGKLWACLFKLDDKYFLDTIPESWDFPTNQATLVSISMFPGHLLFRVSRLEPELKMSTIDSKWLSDYVDKNPTELAYHKEGGGAHFILTAETRDLPAVRAETSRRTVQGVVRTGAGDQFGGDVSVGQTFLSASSGDFQSPVGTPDREVR